MKMLVLLLFDEINCRHSGVASPNCWGGQIVWL